MTFLEVAVIFIDPKGLVFVMRLFVSMTGEVKGRSLFREGLPKNKKPHGPNVFRTMKALFVSGLGPLIFPPPQKSYMRSVKLPIFL
jgi:hypothetical protein